MSVYAASPHELTALKELVLHVYHLWPILGALKPKQVRLGKEVRETVPLPFCLSSSHSWALVNHRVLNLL